MKKRSTVFAEDCILLVEDGHVVATVMPSEALARLMTCGSHPLDGLRDAIESGWSDNNVEK